MTSYRTDIQILLAGSFPPKVAHFSAPSAIQAKAQPSMRTGAGGVGGLVAVSIDGNFYFPGYDNNGNVIGYWNETGSLAAEYAYDAFGNTIYSSGSMSAVFPHRFSTKYYDTETDLYYYGYRYYSPSFGRWISRDPIGEEGGNNMYQFNSNTPMGIYDCLGLAGVEHLTRLDDKKCLPVNSLDEVSVLEQFERDDEAGVFKYEDPVVIFCNGKVDTIRLITTIYIHGNYNYKESHYPGQSIIYHRHSVSGTALAGGYESNPIRPSILAHEKGHGRAYFEIVKPRVDLTLSKFIGRSARNRSEQWIVERAILNAWTKETTTRDFLGASSRYSNDGTVQFYSNGPYLRLGSSGPGWGNYYWIRMQY